MPDDLAGAASAPAPAPPDSSAPASPAPVSAERAAATAGDFGAFDRAAVARKSGKALPDVQPAAVVAAEDTGEPGAPLDPDRPMSSRQRKDYERQQAINRYEQRIAQQEQRLRELESRVVRPGASDPQSRADVAPPANGNGPPAPETAKQRAARYLALADAPKVEDFDSYPEYTAAQTLFLQDRLQAEQAAVVEQRQQQTAQHERLIARDQGFRERLTAAKEADPQFVAQLSDEAKGLGGLDYARRSGQTPGPTHIIGELLYDSPQAPAFLRYISADPQALAQLVALPDAIARLPPAWRAKAHVDHLVAEFRRLEGRLAYEASLQAPDSTRDDETPPPSSVSTAPPPPPTLTKAGRSTDPVRSALDRGDFAAFDAADLARRSRQRTGGRR